MTNGETVTFGAVGAIAPEVLRYYKLVTAGGTMPDLTIGYLGITLVYVVLAAAFALAFKPNDRWKAVWVGASLPVLISALVATAPPTS